MSGGDPREYRFQQQITSEGVITRLAARPDGRFVMVHLLSPTTSIEHRQLLSAVDEFAARERAVVLDRIVLEDQSVGIVTDLLQGFDSFERWFARRSGHDATRTPTPAQAPPRPASPPAAPAAPAAPLSELKGRGEFTQLFGGVRSPLAPAPSASLPPAPPPTPPPAPPPAPPSAPPSPTAKPAGSFTQIFGAQSSGSPAAPPVAPPPPPMQPPAAPARPAPKAVEQDPHERDTLAVPMIAHQPPPVKAGHAQIFAAVGHQTPHTPQPTPPENRPAPPPPPAAPAAAAPPAPPASPPQQRKSTSFTHLFGAHSPPPSFPKHDESPIFSKPPGSSTPAIGAGTQRGGALDARDPIGSMAPPSQNPQKGVSDTHFFRALDSTGPGSKPGLPTPPTPPPAAPPPKGKPGEFTMLMSGVVTDPARTSHPAPPAATTPPFSGQPPAKPIQSVPAVAPGPGEFTRIISAPPSVRPPSVTPPSAPAIPPPAPAAPRSQESSAGDAPPRASKAPLIIAIVAIAVVVLAMVLYFAFRPRPTVPAAEPPAAKAAGSPSPPARTPQDSARE